MLAILAVYSSSLSEGEKQLLLREAIRLINLSP